MQNAITGEVLTFDFNGRFLSRDEDDKDLSRELPVDMPGSGQEPLPVIRYEINVVTSDTEDSETDARVYLCLFGEFGDCGRRQLYRSSSDAAREGSPFQKGKV